MYQYYPLAHGEIRLLLIEPGRNDEPLRGSMYHVPLDNAPPFIAVSYAWGDPTLVQSVSLNEGELRVTGSLAAALKRFRYNAHHMVNPMLFWADQACINQSDTNERGRQVRLMGRIYQQASCVWAWLGEEEKSDTLAFHALRTLCTFLETDYKEYGSQPGKHAWPVPVLKRMIEHLQTHLQDERCCQCCKKPYELPADVLGAAMNALHQLDQRTWFKRLWIVQEMFNAQWSFVSTGTHMINVKQLQDAGVAIQQLLGYRPGPTFINAPSVFALGKHMLDPGYMPDLPLLAHVQLMLWSKAVTEPRDRIYAMRELALLHGDANLKPDYSISTTELYRRATLHILMAPQKTYSRRGGAAVVLALVGTQDRTKSTPRLPSWVPDFNNLTNSSNVKGTKYSWHTSARAGGYRTFKIFNDAAQPDMLRISGVVFSPIAACLRYEDYRNADKTFLKGRKHPRTEAEAQTIRSLPFYYVCHNFITAGGAYPTREPVTEVLRRTLICDITHDVYPVDGPSYEQCFRAYATLADLYLRTDRPNYDDPLLNQAYKYLRAWRVQAEYATNRQLCRTRNGYVCWAPHTALPGDVVCVLSGAPWPFVLRKKGHSSERYMLLGDAYIHGIMNGEATPANEADLVSFEIV